MKRRPAGIQARRRNRTQCTGRRRFFRIYSERRKIPLVIIVVSRISVFQRFFSWHRPAGLLPGTDGCRCSDSSRYPELQMGLIEGINEDGTSRYVTSAISRHGRLPGDMDFAATGTRMVLLHSDGYHARSVQRDSGAGTEPGKVKVKVHILENMLEELPELGERTVSICNESYLHADLDKVRLVIGPGEDRNRIVEETGAQIAHLRRRDVGGSAIHSEIRSVRKSAKERNRESSRS